jgi:hypothetical protein
MKVAKAESREGVPVGSDGKKAVDTLERIQELWIELGRTKADTPEYDVIIKKIRFLSAEYKGLGETPSPKYGRNYGVR